MNCCPGCKKLLPHCCLCLLPLNCVPPDPRLKQKHGQFWSSGELDQDMWFTWCQTCKHGGHNKHVREWFETHDECPVSDCNCICNSH